MMEYWPAYMVAAVDDDDKFQDQTKENGEVIIILCSIEMWFLLMICGWSQRDAPRNIMSKEMFHSTIITQQVGWCTEEPMGKSQEISSAF